MTLARNPSATARLVRAGFTDVARAKGLLEELAGKVVPLPSTDDLVEMLSQVADPDLALLQLVRLTDSPGTSVVAAPAAASDLEPTVTSAPDLASAVADVLCGPDVVRRRFLAVLGASQALGDEMLRRPELLAQIALPGIGLPAQAVRSDLLEAVGADPQAQAPVATPVLPVKLAPADVRLPASATITATDALRRAYRSRILRIAADDLTSLDPLAALPQVAAALADLAAATLEAALAIARSQVPDHAAVRLAVIGMGKAGGRELNYVSDVDVIYVAQPADARPAGPADAAAGNATDSATDSAADATSGDASDEATEATHDAERRALAAGTALAIALQKVCAAAGNEPAIWEVDAALRPEGKNGPLVRTVDSHLAYYQRWAQSWEFQALLKARPLAGDMAVGDMYLAAVSPLVWAASSQPAFVENAQAMRRRVESYIKPAEADREIKLGQGGLRDVEFTVQLLQLVHGRTSAALQVRGTLEALAALATTGYVARDHAARLADMYCFERALEHRIQLFQLRRTHLLPDRELDLRRLARSLGMGAQGSQGLLKRWTATRLAVRQEHEALFYRPLLPAYAQLTDAEISLAPDAARARLAAIGYRDPQGALRHIAALTAGTSRRATLQRHLLPIMLAWFATGADPDHGLLAFRTLSDTLGGTHWYLKLLRDSGTAAQLLAHVLASSAYVADAISRSPGSVRWFDDADGLVPPGPQRLLAEATAVVDRAVVDRAVGDRAAAGSPAAGGQPGGQAATGIQSAAVTLRALRRRELARTAAAEVLGQLDAVAAASAITDATDVTLAGALRLAEQAALAQLGLTSPVTRMLVVAMGRLGGREVGYGSDADVMFVHDPLPGADAQLASKQALVTASLLRDMLGAVGDEPQLPVDADLRPEGRQGPLVRTLASYREYYQRWSSVWEAQALLRARPIAGCGVDPGVGSTEVGLAAAGTAAAGTPGLASAAVAGTGPGAGLTGLAADFIDLIDAVRYPAGGLEAQQVREIKRIKARVESERLPRGVEPVRHLKLGPGGIADVEWTAQLLQLQHAGRVEGLRTTSTVGALRAASQAGLIDKADADALCEVWSLASRLRSANVLWTGRTTGKSVDLLPHDRRDLAGIAGILAGAGEVSVADAGLVGHAGGPMTASQLEDTYLRTARHARTVVERLFYDA